MARVRPKETVTERSPHPPVSDGATRSAGAKAGGPGIDFDELGVNEVVELLDDANMETVVRDFGDRNSEEDPVIHFYELFLKDYDGKKRMHPVVRLEVCLLAEAAHAFLELSGFKASLTSAELPLSASAYVLSWYPTSQTSGGPGRAIAAQISMRTSI